MNRNVIIAGAAAFVLAASPIVAAETQGGPAPAAGTEEAKPVAEKKICKRADNDMGTRMSGKVCKTAAEWKAHYEGERKAYTDQDDRGDRD